MSLRRKIASLAVLAALSLPPVATAQYVMAVREHDWTVVVAQRRFGLEQTTLVPGDARFTRIYWGFGTTETSWRAPTIALVMGGSLAALLVGATLVFAMRGSSSRGKRSRDD